MARVFVGVGSNVGHREGYLKQAFELLATVGGVHIVKQSPVYETEPVGGPKQGRYLNAVWELKTDLSVHSLLDEIVNIEKSLGRIRSVRFAPRTIDLDILFYDDLIVDSEHLKVPHPMAHKRLFVLEPLADLAPDWRHPKFNKTIRSLLKELYESNPKS